MAQINPNASTLIDDYIKNSASFSKEICATIRELIPKTNSPIISYKA